MAAILFVLLFWITTFSKHGTATTTTQGAFLLTEKAHAAPDVRVKKELSTRLHREVLHGVQVLWQAPPGDACGILVVLHGCNHGATDFFSDAACGGDNECLGLPEERAIVQLGLERRLVVVALSSQNRKSKCWSPARDNEPVTKVLLELQQRWSLLQTKPLPLIAFGASSGGHLVTQLDASLEAAGGRLDAFAFIAQVAAGTTQHARQTRCGVYITMNRDVPIDQSVDEAIQILTAQPEQRNSHPNFALRHIRLDDLPLHDLFFTERIGDEYPPTMSRAMVQALREQGALDAKTGKLIHDPRKAENDWYSALRPVVPLAQDSLQPDESPIREVLNVAYAKHEMARDGVAEALDFCMPKLDRPLSCM